MGHNRNKFYHSDNYHTQQNCSHILDRIFTLLMDSRLQLKTLLVRWRTQWYRVSVKWWRIKLSFAVGWSATVSSWNHAGTGLVVELNEGSIADCTTNENILQEPSHHTYTLETLLFIYQTTARVLIVLWTGCLMKQEKLWLGWLELWRLIIAHYDVVNHDVHCSSHLARNKVEYCPRGQSSVEPG